MFQGWEKVKDFINGFLHYKRICRREIQEFKEELWNVVRTNFRSKKLSNSRIWNGRSSKISDMFLWKEERRNYRQMNIVAAEQLP